MKKLLFFDIDGTLAYPTQPPAVSTVDAIREARNHGHKAFISTGRTWDSIPLTVADIGFDGGIFSAGGIVMLGNSILAQHHIYGYLNGDRCSAGRQPAIVCRR